MLRNILNRFEDSKRSLLGPNIWIMKKLGLLLPQSLCGKIMYIIIHETVALFVLSQYIELIEIRSDLDLVLTNMRISMLSIVCIVKANTFVFWQKQWLDVLDYITEADNFERRTRDEPKGLILDSFTKYCRKVNYSYWILVFATFVSTATNPLIHYLSAPTFRQAIHNGSELFPHIFSSYVPFDKYSFPGNWITVVWHVSVCAYGAGIMAAYDSSIMVMMVFFGGKLDLLRVRCKQMYGTDDNGITDEEAATVVRQLHTIHVQYLKYFRLFNSLLSPVMFVYVVLSSLMICASLYQLSSVTNPAQKLLMAEYVIFGIAQLAIFCWHSNDVLTKNEKLKFGPYESCWWNATKKQRESALILSGQMGITHVFTAGPFTNLTLTTFTNILKGAYSYYTILR